MNDRITYSLLILAIIGLINAGIWYLRKRQKEATMVYEKLNHFYSTACSLHSIAQLEHHRRIIVGYRNNGPRWYSSYNHQLDTLISFIDGKMQMALMWGHEPR